ncbi:prolyl 3-hydroxylase 1-like isoform X2 [Watersipora subatra]|uniref:prolyl 3-hydroxylase 1-like isoform X2 n=1 Tax=Watersipora subatra TaxID=2589382 RepID=UPI00355BD142
MKFFLAVIISVNEIFLCSVVSFNADQPVIEKTECDLEYTLMKDAYYDDQWNACVKHGSTAMLLFNQHQIELANCHASCHIAEQFTSPDILVAQYSSSLLQTSCISQCKPTTLKYYSSLLRREPYDYIQICYFKLGESSKGAAAATTFLVVNPTHEYMRNNLKNYKNVLHVGRDHFIDLEAGEYETLYKQGVDLYEGGKWFEQAKSMLAALNNYHLSYNNCSLLCEAGYQAYTSDYDENHSVAGAIADQMEKMVRCKHGCRARLSKLDLQIVKDILTNMYHHLQYSYTKLGDYSQGAAYAAAFLLHHPWDADMLRNKKYLMETMQVSDELFIPPEREMRHKEIIDSLDRLMNYLDTEYISQHSDGISRKDRKHLLEEFHGGNIEVNATGEILGGPERFVADGFATQQECESLIEMCKVYGNVGDGYTEKNPHTLRENFQGISVDTAIELVEGGLFSSSLLSLYLELSERTREYTQLYFNLHQLYFDFTHLVCRTAVDAGAVRDDLSHPIHSDNCIIQENGLCNKVPPAYAQRDYSGILYLNDDFEGGEFFFTDKSLHEQASVKPKCGRLVAFNAGDFHGVKAVQSGRRCAVAVWFTLNPDFMELSRINALNLLKDKKAIRDEL